MVLDTIRSLLAVLVALGHFFVLNGVNDRVPSSFFLAVDFFFILSGFVLAQSVFFDKSTQSDDFLLNFTIRRLFRLFPLYLTLSLICILILILIYRFGLHFDSFYYLLISTLLLQTIGFSGEPKYIFADTTIGISWSTSVEFWVGIPFFLIIFLLRSMSTSRKLRHI